MPDFSSFASLPNIRIDGNDISGTALIKLFQQTSNVFKDLPEIKKQLSLMPDYRKTQEELKAIARNNSNDTKLIATSIKALTATLEKVDKSSAQAKAVTKELSDINKQFQKTLTAEMQSIINLTDKVDKLSKALGDKDIAGTLDKIVKLLDTRIAAGIDQTNKATANNRIKLAVGQTANSSDFRDLESGLISINSYLRTLSDKQFNKSLIESAVNSSFSKRDIIQRIATATAEELNLNTKVFDSNRFLDNPDKLVQAFSTALTQPTEKQAQAIQNLESSLNAIERNTRSVSLTNAEKMRQEDRYEEEQAIQIRIAEALEELVKRDNSLGLDLSDLQELFDKFQDSIDHLAEQIEDLDAGGSGFDLPLGGGGGRRGSRSRAKGKRGKGTQPKRTSRQKINRSAKRAGARVRHGVKRIKGAKGRGALGALILGGGAAWYYNKSSQENEERQQIAKYQAAGLSEDDYYTYGGTDRVAPRTETGEYIDNSLADEANATGYASAGAYTAGSFVKGASTAGKVVKGAGPALSIASSALEYAGANSDKERADAITGGVGGLAGAGAGAAAGAALGSVVPVIGTAIGGVIGAILGGLGGDALGRRATGWFTDVTDEIPDEITRDGKVAEIRYIDKYLRPKVLTSLKVGDGIYVKSDLDDLEEYYWKLFKEVAYDKNFSGQLLNPLLFTEEQIRGFKIASAKLLEGDPLNNPQLSREELEKFKKAGQKVKPSELQSTAANASSMSKYELDSINNEGVKLFQTLQEQGKIAEATQVGEAYSRVIEGTADKSTLNVYKEKYQNELSGIQKQIKIQKEQTEYLKQIAEQGAEEDEPIQITDMLEQMNEAIKKNPELAKVIAMQGLASSDNAQALANMAAFATGDSSWADQPALVSGAASEVISKHSGSIGVDGPSESGSPTGGYSVKGVAASGKVMRDEISSVFFKATQDAIDQGIGYHNTATRAGRVDKSGKTVTGKSIEQGFLDCSGFVNYLMDSAITSMSDEFATQSEKQNMKKLFGKNTSAADMIKNTAKAGGGLVTGLKNIQDNLVEGMVIGEDWGKDNGRFNNISHIVQVVRDPKTNQLMIAESSSSANKVRMRSLDEYFKSRKSARGLYASNTQAAFNSIAHGNVSRDVPKDASTESMSVTAGNIQPTQDSKAGNEINTGKIDAGEGAGGDIEKEMISVLKKRGLSNKGIALIMGQLSHESGGFKSLTEHASGQKYEGSKILGNTQRGDGPRFKGRGIVQLTGRWNYTDMSKKIGVDLVSNPKLAAHPKYAALIADQFLLSKGAYKLANAGDFKGLTYKINGGFNGIDDRRTRTQKYLKQFANGVPDAEQPDLGGESTENAVAAAPEATQDNQAIASASAGVDSPAAGFTDAVSGGGEWVANEVTSSSDTPYNQSDNQGTESTVQVATTGTPEAIASQLQNDIQIARQNGNVPVIQTPGNPQLAMIANSISRNMNAKMSAMGASSAVPYNADLPTPEIPMQVASGLSTEQANQLASLNSKGINDIPHLAAMTGIPPNLIYSQMNAQPGEFMAQTGNNLSDKVLRITAAQVEIVGGLPQTSVSQPAVAQAPTGSAGSERGYGDPYRISDQSTLLFAANIT